MDRDFEIAQGLRDSIAKARESKDAAMVLANEASFAVFEKRINYDLFNLLSSVNIKPITPLEEMESSKKFVNTGYSVFIRITL